jgi:hypothetical protein
MPSRSQIGVRIVMAWIVPVVSDESIARILRFGVAVSISVQSIW